jgi:outer membrane receptor protein involved in Fe transport
MSCSRPVPLVLALSALFAAPLMAQEITTLAPVVVKGQAFQSERSPYTSSGFEQESIREQAISQPQELFARVPGMEWRRLHLGGVADNVTLRGFSSGGHGGAIGMSIDGIPLNESMSHADGYADLNVLVPLEIERMTVYKGPVSALYGNFNRAGTIELTSRKSGGYREADVSYGAWNTADAQAAWGSKVGAAQLNLAAQVYHTDGFREQSDHDRSTFSGRLGFDVSERTQLAVSLRTHHGHWDAPSYITQAEFDNPDRRYKKNPYAMNDGGSKHFASGRVDASHALNPDLTLLAFAYGTRQDFTRYFSRPLNAAATTWRQREESYERDVKGAGVNLNGSHAARKLNWVAGVESFREDTAYLRIDGLDNRSRANGNQTHDRRYAFNSNAAFMQGEWSLSPLFRPSAGLRHDRFFGDCRRLGAETATDACGEMNRASHTSPKLGVRSTLSPAVELRASAAEGFALAGDAVKYGAGAAGAQANVFRQLEMGMRFKPVRQAVADLALFRLDSNNEITEYPAGSGTYANWGKTRREGVEAELHFYPSDAWELSAALSFLDSRIRDNPNAALIGKEVPVVPRRMHTFTAAYRPGNGWGGQATWRQVGAYPLNDANSLSYGGYATLDLLLSYERKSGSGRQRYYAVLANASDRAYATYVGPISGALLYAPAAPRHLTVGAAFDF